MSSSSDPLGNCLSILRRMPPSRIEDDLNGLVNLFPDYEDELLQRVDQPLMTEQDTLYKDESDPSVTSKPFLLCDYNRDGDSYRSPWSNTYFPPLDDGILPSKALRKIEMEMNELVKFYTDMYYEGGISSVYLWENDEDEGADDDAEVRDFAGCVCIKKDVVDNQYVSLGTWNSIHVVEANVTGKDTASYKLTTTILLQMNIAGEEKVGKSNLSGNVTRQMERKDIPWNKSCPHVFNIGQMIEDMENSARNSLDDIYLSKSTEILSSIRTSSDQLDGALNQHTQMLRNAVSKHGATRKIDTEI